MEDSVHPRHHSLLASAEEEEVGAPPRFRPALDVGEEEPWPDVDLVLFIIME